MYFLDARASESVEETFEVRFADDVECEGVVKVYLRSCPG